MTFGNASNGGICYTWRMAKRLLGIDYGTKYVGLAVSDEGGTLAFPLVVLPNGKHLGAEIGKVCEEKEVKEIILGESKDFSGKENPVQKKILEFKEKLEAALNIPIHFEPEALSSAQARNLGGSGEHNDASAAAIILQSYLDKHHDNHR